MPEARERQLDVLGRSLADDSPAAMYRDGASRSVSLSARALAVYTAAIPIGSYLAIPASLRELLLTVRQPFLVGLVAVVVLACGLRVEGRLPFKLMFSVGLWYAAVASLSSRFHPAVMIVYLAWGLVVFDVMPALGRRDALLVYLRTLAATGLLVLVAVAGWWLALGNSIAAQNLGRGDRWGFGIENPNIFAGLVQATILANYWLLRLGCRRRTVFVAGAALGCYLSYMAGSSNFFVFFGALALCESVLIRGVPLRSMLAALVGSVVAMVVVLAGSESIYQFNSNTSGRLDLWKSAVEQVYQEDRLGQVFVTVAGSLDEYIATGDGYGEVAGGFSGQRIGIDNSYLGAFVEMGFVGVALVLGAWAALLRPAFRQPHNPLSRLAVSTIVAFGAQAAVVSNMASFANSATLSVGIMIAMAMGQLAKSQPHGVPLAQDSGSG